MKTVIPLDDGSIASDSTARARMIDYKKGKEVTLNDLQADFLVDCGKAEYKTEAPAEAPKKPTTKKA